MADAAAYEAKRRRQIEENMRRIEELGLRNLPAAAMPPQAKRAKDKARVPGAAAASIAAPIRRSGRLANLPEQPDYRENKKIVIGMTSVERSYSMAKAKAKAKELECELGADYPTFVKTITQHSATATSLVLMGGLVKGQSLPLQFCVEHLPELDQVITLVDDTDEEFDMQYYKEPRHRKYSITSNWKGFAINHELDNGDCLVFQLIQHRKFKVHIMRTRSYLEDDHQN